MFFLEPHHFFLGYRKVKFGMPIKRMSRPLIKIKLSQFEKQSVTQLVKNYLQYKQNKIRLNIEKENKSVNRIRYLNFFSIFLHVCNGENNRTLQGKTDNSRRADGTPGEDRNCNSLPRTDRDLLSTEMFLV